MNRTIKFRGKRLDNGEWLYGSLIVWVDSCTIYADAPSPKRYFITENDRGCLNTISGQYAKEVIPETVGQYTGTIDIDDKEIYEGDIVGIQMADPKEMYKAVVEFSDFRWYLKPVEEEKWIEDWNFIDDSCRFKIIGTIHDKEMEQC